jgi:hypothetical protein
MAKMPALSHVITFGIENGQDMTSLRFGEAVPAVAQAASAKKNEANTFLLTRDGAMARKSCGYSPLGNLPQKFSGLSQERNLPHVL